MPLTGIHSIIMVISAQPGEGGGCTPSPFHSIYIPDPSCVAPYISSPAKQAREGYLYSPPCPSPVFSGLVSTVGPLARSVWSVPRMMKQTPRGQGTVYSNLAVCNFTTHNFNSASRYPLFRPQRGEGERGNRGNIRVSLPWRLKARSWPNTAARRAGWRRVTQQGVILYAMDGPCRRP
jgi:hypothetical protein